VTVKDISSTASNIPLKWWVSPSNGDDDLHKGDAAATASLGTIQYAINRAKDGDAIQLRPGTYGSNVIPLPTGKRISTWMHDHLVEPMVRDVDVDGEHLWSGAQRSTSLSSARTNGKGVGGAFYSFLVEESGDYHLWIKGKCPIVSNAGGWYFTNKKGGAEEGAVAAGPTLEWGDTSYKEDMTFALVAGSTHSINILTRNGECRAYEIYLGLSTKTESDVKAAPLFMTTPKQALQRRGCAPNSWDTRRCNFNLEFGGKAIRLVGSHQGKPEEFVIDCGQTFVNDDHSSVYWLNRRGMVFTHQETKETKVKV
jgi:hypothetical protein